MACLLFVSARAAAQDRPGPGYSPPPPGYIYALVHDPGYHEHDGLFLRITLGAGWLGMSESTGVSELEASGTGSGFGAAIGYAVTRKLIVFLDVSLLDTMHPDVTVNGAPTPRAGEDLTLWGYGPGIAYYFEPRNIFVSAAIAFCKLDLHDDQANTLTATRRGIGLDAMAGKEWWLTTNWALGLALQLQYARMTDRAPDPSPVVSARAISLLGTATFN